MTTTPPDNAPKIGEVYKCSSLSALLHVVAVFCDRHENWYVAVVEDDKCVELYDMIFWTSSSRDLEGNVEPNFKKVADAWSEECDVLLQRI